MALIPPAFLNTVVALGSPAQDGKILYNATGFMYGYSAGTTSENGQKQYHIFLVTNRHVFERAAERSDTPTPDLTSPWDPDQMYIRCN